MQNILRGFRVGVVVLVGLLGGASFSAGAQEEYDAHCKDLTERVATVKNEMFDNRVPVISPDRMLQAASCLDRVLSARVNIGLFFDLGSILDDLVNRFVNRACSVITAAWDNAVRRTRYDLNVNDVVQRRSPW